jgi:hypothetical protein
VLPTLAAGTACGRIQKSADKAEQSSAGRTTGPPPDAKQPPGPPLATASAPPARTVISTDPDGVAVDCYARWQSYDSRNEDPGAGVRRARRCLTADFFTALGGTATQPDTRAWLDLRAAGARSTVTVLAASPLGGQDSRPSGRVVLVLNVRRTTVSNRASPVTSVETPAVTMLQGADGTWKIGAADRQGRYGDAPGA